MSHRADRARRERRDAPARSRDGGVRLRAARLHRRLPAAVPARARAAARHPAGHRPDRLGQDHHAVLRAVASSTRPTSRSSPSRTRSNTSSTASTRSRSSRRSGWTSPHALALDPAPGPGHHHGRRNPRPGNRAHRHPGRAHRPPGASTLHTNDAAGGITRLLDMGVEDYLLTSTINGILAQRLVRRLEPTHAERYPGVAGGNREVRAAPLPARRRRSTCTARAVRRSRRPATSAAPRSWNSWS